MFVTDHTLWTQLNPIQPDPHTAAPRCTFPNRIKDYLGHSLKAASAPSRAQPSTHTPPCALPSQALALLSLAPTAPNEGTQVNPTPDAPNYCGSLVSSDRAFRRRLKRG